MTSKARILKTLKWVAFGIVVLIFVLQVILSFLIPEEDDIKNRLPVMIFEVESDSMYPKLRTGDGVMDVNTPYEELEIGDIITYYDEGDIITHQVTGFNDKGMVLTSGIYPVMQDEAVEEEMYLGRVCMKLPGLSYFLNMTDGPVRKILWIALILFILFGPELIFKVTEKFTKNKVANTKSSEE